MAVEPKLAASPCEPLRRPSALHALPFATPFLVLLIIANASVQGGWWIFVPYFFPIAIGDLVSPLRTTNLPLDTSERDLLPYHLLTWLWVPAQISVAIFVFWQILVSGHLAVWETVLLVVITAKSCFSGLSVAHELFHRAAAWERVLGETLAGSFAFTYYRTEHVHIHHVHVATPLDPVTARKGQSSWAFIPWGVFGNILMSWQFESDRLHRRGFPVWHRNNPFWRYGVITALWACMFWWMGEAGPFGGGIGVAMYFGYSVIIITFLRLVDYVEHYGLTRKLQPNGRYERVQTRHSWNASHRFSNWALWNVQRHSDHHHSANRPYPLLQHIDVKDAPQLPANYIIMFMLALFPPLWYRVMDPLLDAWRKQFYPEVQSWRPYECKLYNHATGTRRFFTVVEIMETSPRLGDWLEQHPGLLDYLDQPEFTDLTFPNNMAGDLGVSEESFKTIQRGLVRVFYFQEFDVSEFVSLTMDSDEVLTEADALDNAREWMNARTFQLGMHILRGNFSPAYAQAPFSKIMDAALDVALRVATRQFGGAGGRGVTRGYAVVAFGDLGRQEAKLGSELRFLLLYDLSGNADQRKYFERLARRLLAVIESLGQRKMLFGQIRFHAVAGADGALSMGEFSSRFRSVDTCLALTEARAVCGDADLLARFHELKRELLAGVCGDERLAGRIRAMRAGYTAEYRAGNFASLAQAPGGFADLRFAEDYLALRFPQKVDDVETLTDPGSVFAEAAARGLLDKAAAQELQAAASLWGNLAGVLPFTTSRLRPDEPVCSRQKTMVAAACDAESPKQLADTVAKTRRQTARRIDTLLQSA